MVQTAAFYGQYLTNAKSGLALDDDSTFCQNIVSIARRIVDRALHDFVKNFVRNRLHFFCELFICSTAPEISCCCTGENVAIRNLPALDLSYANHFFDSIRYEMTSDGV